MSALLVTQAWAELIYVDFVTLFGFRRIKNIVGRPVSPAPSRNGMPSGVPENDTVTAVVDAVRLARVFYIKPVWCLQHSAAVTRLLRRRGVAADLVIGCHHAPLRAHAWVEVAGEVVTQRIDRLEHYSILDRW
jgi:hypothetical protein